MPYTPQTIHSGDRSGGLSAKNAQDIATALEGLDTAVAAAGDVTAAAAATAAALTDSSGGTANQTVEAVSGSGADAAINNNFADLTDEINKLITDVGLIRTAVNAIITALA